MALTEVDTALITSTDLKTYLQIADTSQDTVIAQIVLAVSAGISGWCGRKFAQATYTTVTQGTGTPSLYVRHWPISTPISGVSGYVYVSTSHQWDAGSLLTEHTTDGLTSSGDYVIHPGEEGQGLIERTAGVWPSAVGSVKVKYQGGYATIPDAIKHAAMRWAAQMHTIAIRKLHAVTSESIQAGGGSLSVVAHDMPPDVRRMIAPFKAIRFY